VSKKMCERLLVVPGEVVVVVVVVVVGLVWLPPPPPGKLASQAKLAPYLLFTAQTRHLGPRFPCIYIIGEVCPHPLYTARTCHFGPPPAKLAHGPEKASWLGSTSPGGGWGSTSGGLDPNGMNYLGCNSAPVLGRSDFHWESLCQKNKQ